MDETLTIRPPPSANIHRTTYFVRTMGDIVFTFTRFSIWELCMIANRPSVPTAALLTSPKIGPKSLLMVLTSSPICAILARSKGRKWMAPLHAALLSAIAQASASVSRRAMTMTRSPAEANLREVHRPSPRLPPVTMTLRMTARQFAGVGDIQAWHETHERWNLMAGQMLLAELANLLFGPRNRRRVLASRGSVQDHLSHDDGTRERALLRKDQCHSHLGMSVDHRLDFLRVHLGPAHVDDAAAAAAEIAAILDAFDHVAGINEAVRTGQCRRSFAQIATGDTIGPDLERAIFDPHLQLAARRIKETCRKALAPIDNLKSHSGFG